MIKDDKTHQNEKARKVNICLSLVLIFFVSTFFETAIVIGQSRTNTQNSQEQEYYELGKSFFTTDIDSSIYYFEKAESLAIASKNKGLWFKLTVNLALAYRKTKNYEQSFDYLKKVEDKKLLPSDSVQLALYFQDMGVALSKLKKHQEAAEYFQKSILCLNEKSEKKTFIESCHKAGIALYKSGNHEHAIVFLTKAYNQSKQKDLAWAQICNNIGLALKEQNKYSLAVHYFENALQLAIDSNFAELKMHSLNNLGQLLCEISVFQKALDCFNEAYKHSELLQDIRFKAVLLNNIGFLHMRKGDIREALGYFKKSNKELNKDTLSNKELLGINYQNLTQAYYLNNNMELAEKSFVYSIQYSGFDDETEAEAKALLIMAKIQNTKKNFGKAKELLLKSRQIALKIQSIEVLAGVFDELGKMESNLRRYDKAFNYQDQHIKLYKQLLNEKQSKAIAGLEIKHQLFKKDKQIKQLSFEKQLTDKKREQLLQKYLYLSLIVGLLVIFSVILIAQLKLKSKAYRKLVKNNLELAKKKGEIKNIKQKTPIQETIADSDKKNGINGKHNAIIEQMEQLFNDDKIFTRPKINITDVAKLLNTNRTYLSEAIRIKHNTTFNQLLNEYRVNEAIQLLSVPSLRITIEAVAEKAGFNSKSTFNTVFKQITGVTPSFFKNNHSEEDDL